MDIIRGTVRLRDNGMDYFSFGTGKKPFVMLPGLTVKSIVMSAEGVAAAYRMFADEFTVTVFDRTKYITENITLEQLAEDTAEAMELLGIKNACVFGTSQGGMIAQCIALAHPDLVGKMILASSCSRLNPVSAAVMNDWVSLAQKGDVAEFCDRFIGILYGEEFAEKFAEFIKIAHRDISAEDFRRFIFLAKSCESFDVYDRLNEISCPVLVTGAVNDKVLTAQASVEIAEKIGCECYMYGSEYGHCVFDEAPDYKQRIMDFFIK